MSEHDPEISGTADFQLGESVLGQLPPRDTTALVRDVRSRLRLAIVLGEFSPGSRLNQVKLARQLGVSRMPVRTATTELVSEGLLEVLPGGGVEVRSLTQRDLSDVFEVRTALESRAVRHVAEQQPLWGLARITKVVDSHKSLIPTYGPAQLLAADRDFHMSILDATGNSFFQRSLMPVWSIVERTMVQSLNLNGIVTMAWPEHEEILQAMKTGDADAAESALRQHLDHAVSELENVIPADGSAAPTAVD